MRVRYIPWQWFFVFLIMFLSILSLAVIAYSSHTAQRLLEQEVYKHNRSLVFFIHTELKLDFQSWIHGSIDQAKDFFTKSKNWKEATQNMRNIQGVQDLYYLDAASNQIVDLFRATSGMWRTEHQFSPWRTQLYHAIKTHKPMKVELGKLPWNWTQNLSQDQSQLYQLISKNGEFIPYAILPVIESKKPRASLIILVFEPSFYRRLLGVLAKRYSGVVLEITGWEKPIYITDSGIKETIETTRLKELHSIGPFSLSDRFKQVQIRAYYPSTWDKQGGSAYDSRYSQYFLAKSKQFGELIVAPLSFLLMGLVLLYWKMRTSQRKIRIQNDWIENLAHDLQTPVHALGTVVEVLGENPDNEPYCRLMSMELQRMRQNARVFMQLAREGASQKLAGNQPFNLNEAIDRAIEMTGLAHRGKEPEFRIENSNPELQILGDRDAILDAFINIMDNSCKYSPNKPQILVSVTMINNQVRIVIQDQGYGIASSEFQRAFQPFYRALNERTEGIQGNGLGLSIVQKVMENHQGKAHIEANEPQGTKIVLTFPSQRLKRAA